MTPAELELYLTLTADIERLEHELDKAVAEKQGLAKTLYERHGRHTVYRVGDHDLMIAPTKSGTYYFAPRVRWPKEARAAKKAKQYLDTVARLQGPVIHPSHTGEEMREPVGAMPQRVGRRGGMTHEGAVQALSSAPSVQEIQAALGQARESSTSARAARRIEITATLSKKSSIGIESDIPAAMSQESQGIDVPSVLASLQNDSSSFASAASHNVSSPEVVGRRGLLTDDEALHVAPPASSEKRRLPLVGDPDVLPVPPEPRLLQIKEPEPDQLEELLEFLKH